MDLLQAVILGIVQGLTEFLPVSSSGHLVLFQQMFGLSEPELFFNVSVHIGTLMAVVFFFRRDVLAIVAALLRGTGLLVRQEKTVQKLYLDPDVKLAVLILVGSVPTAVIGLAFNRLADRLFSSVLLVGIMLCITGSMLWSTRYVRRSEGGMAFFGMKAALLIGLVQGLAILPGISRSGSTIVMGLFLGMQRNLAARYSFLLSIPAILGAELLSLGDFSLQSNIAAGATLIGAVTACVVGYLSLRMLVYIVDHGRMYLFSPYCWLVGIVALISGF